MSDSNDKIFGVFARDRFAAHVGIKLVEVKPGFAAAKMPIAEFHLNGVDVVQGGAIFTLADFAFAAAANSHGGVTLGINASISYFKSPKGKTLMAEAREVSATNKLGSYEVDVFDENGELIARFHGIGYRKEVNPTPANR